MNTKRILALILLAAVLMPCALAHPDDVNIFHWERGMGYQIDSTAYVGGKVYLFTGGETFYTWSEGQELATHAIEQQQTEDDRWIQTAAVVTDGQGLWTVTVESSYDQDTGANQVLGAYLWALTEDENGDLHYGDRVKLNWRDMIEYYEDNEYTKSVRCAYITGGKLLFATYGDNGTIFMRYDVETGEGGPMDMELEGNVYAACAYKDGGFLAFTYEYDYEADKGQDCATVYAVADDGVQTVGKIPVSNWVIPQSPAYGEAQDVLCYVLDGQVMRVDGLDFENAKAVNSASTDGGEQTCYITEDGRYLISSYDAVALKGIDPEARSESRLTVEMMYNNALENAVFAYGNKHPEVEVRTVNTVGDVVQAMMSQDASVDIYRLDTDSAAYAALMNRGYLTDLSGSETITGLVSRLYPWLSDAVTKDGKAYALPFYLNVQVMFSWNKEAAKKLGLEDRRPESWMEFYELLKEMPQLLDDNPAVSLFEPYLTVGRAREQLFAAMLSDYLLYLGTLEPGQRSFDTQEMYNMIKAFESVNFYDLGLAEEEEDSYSWTGENILLQTWGSISPQRWGADENENMLLSVGEGIPARAAGTLSVLIVNPYSKNRDAAIELLETVAEKIEGADRIAMCPDENEPIKSPYAEENLKYIDEYIASLEKSLEEAGEDEKEIYQEQLDDLLEEKQHYLDEYIWDVSAKNIEQYRKDADLIQISTYLGIDMNSDSSEQMRNLLEQYLDGAVDGQTFMRELDQMYRMMMMEGI